MKASELIKRLDELIKEHGDQGVEYEYDDLWSNEAIRVDYCAADQRQTKGEPAIFIISH